MGAYQHIKELYPNLVERAKLYNYPDSSVCILEGDIARLECEFPVIYNNLCSCRHNRDIRTPMEYGQDLVSSWLFEDILMDNLKKAGINLEGVGADKSREVLPNTKVSASSDCIVSFNGKNRLLELMSDYTGYWAKYKKMELRDSKFTKMRESNSLFLGISTTDKKYILLNMSSNLDVKFIASYFLYGGKPAYSIKFAKEQLMDIDFAQIAEDIKSMI